jgi:hypothetical protein
LGCRALQASGRTGGPFKIRGLAELFLASKADQRDPASAAYPWLARQITFAARPRDRLR